MMEYEIIYNDIKIFPKAKRILHILVVFYKESDCIEVVGYDASKDIEAPRLYISASKLIDMMIHTSAQKTHVGRNAKSIVSKRVMANVESINLIPSKDNMAKYLVSRLGLRVKYFLDLIFRSDSYQRSDTLLISKPIQLSPISTLQWRIKKFSAIRSIDTIVKHSSSSTASYDENDRKRINIFRNVSAHI